LLHTDYTKNASYKFVDLNEVYTSCLVGCLKKKKKKKKFFFWGKLKKIKKKKK